MNEIESKDRIEAAVSAVRAIVAKELPEKTRGKTLDADTNLRGALNLDSMDLLALMAAIENAAGEPLPEALEPAKALETIGSLARSLIEVGWAWPPERAA